MKNYLGEIVTFVLTALSGGVAWFWSKKRARHEREKDNNATVQDVIATALSTQNGLLERNAELTRQLIEATRQNAELQAVIVELKAEVTRLNKEVARLSREVQGFKKTQENKN